MPLWTERIVLSASPMNNYNSLVREWICILKRLKLFEYGFVSIGVRVGATNANTDVHTQGSYVDCSRALYRFVLDCRS